MEQVAKKIIKDIDDLDSTIKQSDLFDTIEHSTQQ